MNTEEIKDTGVEIDTEEEIREEELTEEEIELIKKYLGIV